MNELLQYSVYYKGDTIYYIISYTKYEFIQVPPLRSSGSSVVVHYQ